MEYVIMKLKEKELWLELYEVAQKIQDIEPWKYLWDMDVLMYLSEPLQDIFYCSVMGRAGLHKAIAVYRGRQINRFYESAKNKFPPLTSINYQECLICQFMSRNDTLKENRDLIKEIGLSFRGIWISFENFEKGYEPSVLSLSQVKVMIEALKNFYMMFRAIIEQGMIINFDHYETLIRRYDKKTKLYFNYVDKLFIPEDDYGIVSVDKNFERDILKVPQNSLELEYEFMNYFPMRIKENKEADGRYYYPRSRILMDRKTGLALYQKFVDKNDYENEQEYIIESVKFLTDYMFEKGRPKTIYVRDDETKYCLEDILNKAHVNLRVNSKLKVIDKFYDEFSKFIY